MLRTFETHKIRKYRELTGSSWNFTALSGDKEGVSFPVFTPSNWESYPNFFDYRGCADYTTSFRAKGNLRLIFEGISHTAKVYVDNEFLTEHYNAYTPFDAIIKNAGDSAHTLKINVDNRFGEQSALHIPNDYMTYGGINRPIALEEIPDVFVRFVHVSTRMLSDNVSCNVISSHEEKFGTDSHTWEVTNEICLQNITDTIKTVSVSSEFADKKITRDSISVPACSTLLIRNSAICRNITEWSPEDPHLYEINTVLYENGIATDDLIERFGFREIGICGKKILLNNKPLLIKGFCRHEDHPEFCAALPVQAMAYDLDLICDMGANSVRTSHYPNDSRFLDLCDERGILVWEENHARGLSLSDMQNPNFEPQAEKVICEMIEAHFNHPCIYIWGILNECASDTEYGKECYKKQLNLIKSLDTTRPTSFASCKFKTDICFGLPDVVSYNIYPLWYHDTPVKEYLDDLYSWVQNETEGCGKPFLITETGAGGIYGVHTPYDEKWTEEYQAKTVKAQIDTILANENTCGVYIWQFCDVRVSKEWFHVRPRCMNNKGIVDEYRRKKLAYKEVKEIFERYGNYR